MLVDSADPGVSERIGRAEPKLSEPIEGLTGRNRILLGALLGLATAALFLGALRQEIGGDETFFLATIHRAASNQPIPLLQTAYVHLFGWLTEVGGGEVAQITIGRLLNIALWIGSLGLLYRLGRDLVDPPAAQIGVVLFALFSFSVWNAASFRIDGLLLPVLLAIAILLIKPTTNRVAIAGALSGLALALSIKAALWAPAFAGVLAFGLWKRREWPRPLLAGSVAGAVAFGGIMWAHASLIAGQTGPTAATFVGSAQSAATVGSYMLAENGLFPQWQFLARALTDNAITWCFLAVGLYLTSFRLIDPRSRHRDAGLLLLSAPALSPVFYANSYPYAYLIFMPVACLLAGRGLAWFMTKRDKVRAVSVLVCFIAAASPLAHFLWWHRTDKTAQQRQIVQAVHALFQEPVPYIDGHGMIASFPRWNQFVSPLGLSVYRRHRNPALASFIQERQPPLLIVNAPALDVWPGGEAESLDPSRRLLPQDEAAIRATYAPYWGSIHLAGRQWRELAPGESVAFEIAIPGEYTVLAAGTGIIDGRPYAPGATLRLEAGPHALRASTAEPDLRLLWGAGVQLPEGQGPPASSSRE